MARAIPRLGHGHRTHGPDGQARAPAGAEALYAHSPKRYMRAQSQHEAQDTEGLSSPLDLSALLGLQSHNLLEQFQGLEGVILSGIWCWGHTRTVYGPRVGLGIGSPTHPPGSRPRLLGTRI